MSKSNPKNANKFHDEESVTPPNDLVDSPTMPEGFHSVKAERDAVWWMPEPGQSVQGVLLGRYSMGSVDDDEGERYYYQLRLTKSCEVKVYEPEVDMYMPSFADVGKAVNIGERSDLKILADYIPKSDEKFNEVWIAAISKIRHPSKPGRRIWRFDVAARPYKKREKAASPGESIPKDFAPGASVQADS